MTDIRLYGGKGGVGKTTIAAASAVRSAASGRETLLVSTDPAHSLSDTVGTGVGGEPTELRPDLWGVEVDPQAGMERYRALFEALAAEFAAAGIRLDEEEIAELFTSGVMPGSDELAALEGLVTYLDDDRWDRVVFDTAPTGHTLRLLDLPSVLDRSIETALDLRDQVRRKVDTARTMLFGPMAARRSDDVDEFAALKERLSRAEMRLRDPGTTEFHVVTVPETMAARETERLVDQLRTFDVPVTTLVVNRVIDDPGDCDRCRAKASLHDDTLDELRRSLPGLDVRTVPDVPGEVTGFDDLERVGDRLGFVEG